MSFSLLLTFFPIHRLRQRFWACGLFCFDYFYLFGFCHFILVFICHSPYLGFINLFSYFAFCLLRLSFFPVAFLFIFNLSVMFFTLPFIWVMQEVSHLLALLPSFFRFIYIFNVMHRLYAMPSSYCFVLDFNFCWP